jgi:hypothetical protein
MIATMSAGDWRRLPRLFRPLVTAPYLLFCALSRRRTPGPPPFSSMNSTPAASETRLISSPLDTVSYLPPLELLLQLNANSSFLIGGKEYSLTFERL